MLVKFRYSDQIYTCARIPPALHNPGNFCAAILDLCAREVKNYHIVGYFMETTTIE